MQAYGFARLLLGENDQGFSSEEEKAMKILAMSLALFVLTPVTASAHIYVTKDGRQINYSDNGCCNGNDCRPIKSYEGVDSEGNLTVITDDDIRITVPKTLVRKPSRDRLEHVCASSIAKGEPGNAHCMFIPMEANMSRRQLFATIERDLLKNICTTN